MMIRLLLILCLILPSPLLAAVTEVGTATTGSDTGGGTSISVAKTITGGANTCATVQLSYYNGSGAVAAPTLSWNTSEAFTTVNQGANAGGDFRSAVYYLATPTGGSFNLTGTFSNTALWRLTFREWSSCGGNHGGANATGSSTTPSVNVTSVVAGEVTLDGMVAGSQSGNPSPGAGQNTTNQHIGQLVSSIYSAGSTDSSTTGTVAQTYTIASGEWVISAMALTESAGGGAVTPKLMLMGVGP